MILSVIIYVATLALAGIILWYVIEFLPIPAMMKIVAQLLLALILILSGISVATTKGSASDYPMVPIPKAPASIIR